MFKSVLGRRSIGTTCYNKTKNNKNCKNTLYPKQPPPPPTFMRIVSKPTTITSYFLFSTTTTTTIHSFTIAPTRFQYLSRNNDKWYFKGGDLSFNALERGRGLRRRRTCAAYSTSDGTGKRNKQKAKKKKSSHDDDDDENDEELDDDLYLLSVSSSDITNPTSNATTTTSVVTPETKFVSSYHAPVMWKECIEALHSCNRAQERQQQLNQQSENVDEMHTLSSLPSSQQQQRTQPLIYVDGTLGGGGHCQALLESLLPGDIVFGADVDPDALHTASQRLSQYMLFPPTTNNNPTHNNDRPWFIPVPSNFADLTTNLLLDTLTTKLKGIEMNTIQSNFLQQIQDDGLQVDGILLDLGVSSYQIDTAERGFAFMKDGPLDMRMDRQGKNYRLNAADLCNEMDVMELRRIFQTYGDEPRARVIAESIVRRRPLATTNDLYEAVAAVTPQFVRKGRRMGRMATLARIFQSLRIVVNQEDVVLERALTQMAPALLRQGGRLVVLSYHSMEDRATKRVMRDGTVSIREAERNNIQRDMYGNYSGAPKPFRAIGKAQKATDEEVLLNARARSATLRVAERL